MREASRSGRVAIQSISAPMSLTESSRLRPLSSSRIRLAVAARAAHVRKQDRDAQLVQVEVVAAEESRLELRLRPAVDVDDDRPPAGELRGRLVEEARDRPAVEALPAHQLGLDEVRRVRARRSRSPSSARPGRWRHRPSTHPRAIAPSSARARSPCRSRASRARRSRPPAGRSAARPAPLAGVDQAQPADAVLVGDDGDRAAVGRHVEQVDVPADVVV